MKKILIAFDCDGTLVRDVDLKIPANIEPIPQIRDLLVLLAKMENTEILVWSGTGKRWAKQVAKTLGIAEYVDRYADKIYVRCDMCDFHCEHARFKTKIRPDIAVDDVRTFDLAAANLIVGAQ